MNCHATRRIKRACIGVGAVAWMALAMAAMVGVALWLCSCAPNRYYPTRKPLIDPVTRRPPVMQIERQ